jgi:hypothetical protein
MRILGLIWDDPENINVATGRGGIFANLFGTLGRHHQVMLKDVRVKSRVKLRLNLVTYRGKRDESGDRWSLSWKH